MTNPSLITSASSYLASGLCVLPARRLEKRPAIGSWKRFQERPPTEAELTAWLANSHDAICILCGRVSGNTEMIDFDAGGDRFMAWWDRIPHELRERLVIETTPSGGMHVVYRSQVPICGNTKLAQRQVGREVVTLIETRGEGGLFLCAPTQGYVLAHGEFRHLPVLTESERDTLLQAAWELNEYVPPSDDGLQSGPQPSVAARHGAADRPGDDFNARGDVRAVLMQHGWTLAQTGENEYWRRPGKNHGWSASLRAMPDEVPVFYVFSTNAAPFEAGRAYSPFAVYTLLNHGGDFEEAARALRLDDYGSDDDPHEAGVDLSGILAGEQPDDAPPICEDPGPIPEHLFNVPGFVAQVMAFTLANAPYPNIGLAFCGAMALQSFLAGRKVRTPGDLRSNLYLLALASSGTGKDFPRKVNSRVLFEVGLINAVGDKFASGEGIQDALVRCNAMLFQNDEMDGVLRQINLDRENRRESMPNVLLTLYTSANDIYPVRVKAGQKDAIHIDQPHLTLFGTATPQYFYESLSQRMLTNGFFARMIIVDVGKRGAGQTAGSARQLPEPILRIARWWAEYQPGTRRANLQDMHPDPRIVPLAPDAAEAMDRLQRMAEAEYDQAEAKGDEVARTAWSRTCENATKLALIYACSQNHEDPTITLPAVEWATAFAMHQTRRQLFLAQSYVAENPFHGECLKVIRKLREAPDLALSHQMLLKRMKIDAKSFRDLMDTLVQRGDVVAGAVQTMGRAGLVYRLMPRVKEG